jgi:hypothetical protein
MSPSFLRYRRTTSEEEIARHYHIPISPRLDLPISYNIGTISSSAFATARGAGVLMR